MGQVFRYLDLPQFSPEPDKNGQPFVLDSGYERKPWTRSIEARSLKFLLRQTAC